MLGYRTISAICILALPTCLGAQPGRRIYVHVGAELGELRAREFAGPARGAAAALVWREALGRSDVRMEYALKRGRYDNGQDGSPCTVLFYTGTCSRVETNASLATFALTFSRPFARGANVPGERRTYLFGGPAILSGRVTHEVGASDGACLLGGLLGCSEPRPARTVRRRISMPGLTLGGAFEAQTRGMVWFAELRATLGAGLHAGTPTAVQIGVGFVL